MGVECTILDQIYKNANHIHYLCLDTFCDNVVIINGPTRIATAFEEKYLLHDLQGMKKMMYSSPMTPL